MVSKSCLVTAEQSQRAELNLVLDSSVKLMLTMLLIPNDRQAAPDPLGIFL